MTGSIVVAVPTEGTGGIDAPRSAHFGQAASYTVVTLREGAVTEVRSVMNAPHEHGGCLAPVAAIAGTGASAVVVVGIGGRPLAGFAEAGIEVYQDGFSATVRESIEALGAGRLQVMCQSSCGCGHSH